MARRDRQGGDSASGSTARTLQGQHPVTVLPFRFEERFPPGTALGPEDPCMQPARWPGRPIIERGAGVERHRGLYDRAGRTIAVLFRDPGERDDGAEGTARVGVGKEGCVFTAER